MLFAIRPASNCWTSVGGRDCAGSQVATHSGRPIQRTYIKTISSISTSKIFKDNIPDNVCFRVDFLARIISATAFPWEFPDIWPLAQSSGPDDVPKSLSISSQFISSHAWFMCCIQYRLL